MKNIQEIVSKILHSSQGSSRQLRELLSLGMPIVISMAAIIGLGVTDSFMAGLASTLDLAALAIAANLFFVCAMLIIGLQSIVAPRIAAKLGAAEPEQIGRETRQAMWIGAVVGIILIFVVWAILPFIGYLGLSSDVESVAALYLKIVCWALPLIGINTALRNTFDGLHHTRLNMVISLAVFFLNLLLDYLFVFGKAGFPAMGAIGCAIASCFVVAAQTALYCYFACRHTALRQYRLLHRFEWPVLSAQKRLLVLGMPAALSLTLEEGFFSATTMLAGPMGEQTLAAHQIALNIAVLTMIIPIALGQAAAILIGRSIGGQQPVLAREQSLFLIRIIATLTLLIGLVLLYFRQALMEAYTDDLLVVTTGATLLAFCGIQLFVDGLQIASGIALKGYQDTLVPALFQILSCWVIGFPLAYVLSHTSWLGKNWGINGIWSGMLIALSCVAILNVSRLIWISRQMISVPAKLKMHL